MVDNLYDYKTSDLKLTPGMEVYANWTNEGFHYREKAIIVKLDGKNVTVRLQSSRCAANQVVLPRFVDQTRWSFRNCVWPIEKNSSLRRKL